MAAPPELDISSSHDKTSSIESASGGGRTSVKNTWLPDIELVDSNDIAINVDRLDKADVIGVRYLSH